MNLVRSHFRRSAVAHRKGRVAASSAEYLDPDLTDVIVVRAAVASLPERQRAAIALRYFADLSVHETAEALGCPEGTVKTLTRDALRALRAQGFLDWERVDDGT
jgi:DNA-directed RNA polymerase specialized sigma24 family protein